MSNRIRNKFKSLMQSEIKKKSENFEVTKCLK